jgi:hypothetical protein
MIEQNRRVIVSVGTKVHAGADQQDAIVTDLVAIQVDGNLPRAGQEPQPRRADGPRRAAIVEEGSSSWRDLRPQRRKPAFELGQIGDGQGQVLAGLARPKNRL